MIRGIFFISREFFATLLVQFAEQISLYLHNVEYSVV